MELDGCSEGTNNSSLISPNSDRDNPIPKTRDLIQSNRQPTKTTNHHKPLVVPANLGGSCKSTAYMRLNNRVKVIERNVSVSMRYLEELSQSYRSQMERFSLSFNVTYAWLKAAAVDADEKNRQQQDRISQLQSQLNDLILHLKPTALLLDKTNDLKVISDSAKIDLISRKLSSSPSPSLYSSPSSPLPFPDLYNSMEWSAPSSSVLTGSLFKLPNEPDECDFVQIEEDEEEEEYEANNNRDTRQTTHGYVSSKTDSASTPINQVPKSKSVVIEDEKSCVISVVHVVLSIYNDLFHHLPSKSFTYTQDWSQYCLDWTSHMFGYLTFGPYYFIVFVAKFYRTYSKVCNIISLALFHLILAVGSQLFIYWTWFRPNYPSCRFDCPKVRVYSCPHKGGPRPSTATDHLTYAKLSNSSPLPWPSYVPIVLDQAEHHGPDKWPRLNELGAGESERYCAYDRNHHHYHHRHCMMTLLDVWEKLMKLPTNSHRSSSCPCVTSSNDDNKCPIVGEVRPGLSSNGIGANKFYLGDHGSTVVQSNNNNKTSTCLSNQNGKFISATKHIPRLCDFIDPSSSSSECLSGKLKRSLNNGSTDLQWVNNHHHHHFHDPGHPALDQDMLMANSNTISHKLTRTNKKRRKRERIRRMKLTKY